VDIKWNHTHTKITKIVKEGRKKEKPEKNRQYRKQIS
jgi:hypothetical protein